MALNDYDALSFDCYGTLIDWETGIAGSVGPWARRNNSSWDDERLLVTYSDHEARAEAEDPAAPYPTILERSFRSLGRQLGYEVTDHDAQAFGRSVPDWPAFPDSHAALVLLSKHAKLIILSNVDKDSFTASNRQLGVKFDAIITAEDVGSYKPSPRNFTALLDRTREIGVSERKLLHVAQSLFHDHVPAKQAGLATVWINRRHDNPGWGATPEPSIRVAPDREFPTMDAFAAAFAKAHSTSPSTST